MPLTKFRKDPKDLKPWTIYIWEEGDIVKGGAQVKGGKFDEIFIAGQIVSEDKEFQRPHKQKDIHTAKSQVKVRLQNTLNALLWYGPGILTKNQIDINKFKAAEMKSGITASGIHIDISHLNPVRKFPEKNITFEKAKELGFV